jgi:hypothetical protein
MNAPQVAREEPAVLRHGLHVVRVEVPVEERRPPDGDLPHLP